MMLCCIIIMQFLLLIQRHILLLASPPASSGLTSCCPPSPPSPPFPGLESPCAEGEVEGIDNNTFPHHCSGEVLVVDYEEKYNISQDHLHFSQICLQQTQSAHSQDKRLVILLCRNISIQLSPNSTVITFTSFGIISLFFLCIVFIVYWVLPDFNNLHGKIVLCNVVSIFFLTVFLITVFNFKLENHHVCKLVGYVGFFFSISMFSWMTIMCFDISSTFIQEEIPQHSNKQMKFLLYSTFGWGSGIFLSLILLLFETFLPLESDFNPAVGTQSCFISKKGNTFLYLFHLPILVMMIINISSFIFILVFLIRTHRKTKAIRMSRR